MKKSKFTKRQIIKALKENKQGRKPEEICREFGIHKGTFYNWRKKYAGMDASQLGELKELKEENRGLKQMYADLSLDKVMLKDVLSKSRCVSI